MINGNEGNERNRLTCASSSCNLVMPIQDIVRHAPVICAAIRRTLNV